MRLLAVVLVGLLACWVLWDLTRLALHGLDRAEIYLTPSLTTIYARWLLTMLAAGALTILPAIALMLMFARSNAGPAEAAVWRPRHGRVVALNLRALGGHRGECACGVRNGEGVQAC